MIKLLIPLFLFLPLLSQDKLYSIPDHHTLFTYELNRLCQKSSHIQIITPSFNHKGIKKGILNAAKKGSRVSFVVNDPHGDPLSMVQYEGIDLSTYPHPLKQTIIMIDDSLICSMDGAFEDAILTTRKHLIRCSDNHYSIRTIQHSRLPILKHSKPYLE
jgi:hypothetical protein